MYVVFSNQSANKELNVDRAVIIVVIEVSLSPNAAFVGTITINDLGNPANTRQVRVRFALDIIDRRTDLYSYDSNGNLIEFAKGLGSDRRAVNLTYTPEGYVEGPFMFLRNETYYFMWSEGNWGDDTYKVAYAMSEKATGPFKRIGTILHSNKNIATGAGHNSVINTPNTDNWYIIYHRRPIPNEGRDHRVTCIDKLEFNQDGTIKQVKMTIKGVKKE